MRHFQAEADANAKLAGACGKSDFSKKPSGGGLSLQDVNTSNSFSEPKRRAGHPIKGRVKVPKNIDCQELCKCCGDELFISATLTSGFHMGSGRRIARATKDEKSRKRTPALICKYQVTWNRCVERFCKVRAYPVQAITLVTRGAVFERKRGIRGLSS